MRRNNLAKGLSTALVAMALCLGAPVVSNAAGLDSAQVYEHEVAQYGVAAPAISLKETKMSGTRVTSWTFQFAAVPKGHRMYFNVYEGTDPMKSENGYWNSDPQNQYFYNYSYAEEGETEYTVNAYNLKPGKHTVVAYLYDEDSYYAADWSTGKKRLDYYSPASNPISVNVSLSASVSAVVKSTSITLNLSGSSSTTGYEIYRKEGKKYQKIATVAKNVYTDKGLLSKTTYSYKVRPYYHDEDTGKNVYGEYTQIERTTVGSPLKLKVALSGKRNVKLSWSKIPGAVKYEVYRMNGYSNSDTVSKGDGNGYESAQLLKTLSKKKKTYTDKKTSGDENYYYTVCAVLDNKKRVTVEESGYIEFKFGSPSETASYTNASGAKTVEWNTVYGADGYILERYDVANGEGKYVLDRKLGKSAKKVTLPAPTPVKTETGWTNTSVQYRLYATKGNAKSEGYIYIEVYATLGVVNSVTAKKVSNGIQVSWSAVPGAAYYEVYRCKAGCLSKNKDANYYTNSSYGSQISEYVGIIEPQVQPNTDPTDTKVRYYRNYSYTRSEFPASVTSVLDYAGTVCYNGDTQEEFETVGPKSGVTYQYYVVAYAAEQRENYKEDVYDVALHTWTEIDVPSYGSQISQTMGCKKIAEVNYTNTKAPGKAKLKSVKSSKKKQATITINKVKGAKAYKIYRSTKKKGTYACVGVTTKTKYTDTGLTSGKSYFYKVAAVGANEVGADVDGAASAAKSVKVK